MSVSDSLLLLNEHPKCSVVHNEIICVHPLKIYVRGGRRERERERGGDGDREKNKEERERMYLQMDGWEER